MKEKHTIDSLFIAFLKALFWFHPAVWYFEKEIKNVHEYLADRKAAASDLETYISTLSIKALEVNGLLLSNHFYKSSILNRIKMLNNKNRPKSFKIVLSALLFTGIGFAFSCSQELVPPVASSNEDIQPLNNDEVFNVVEEGATPIGGFPSYFKLVASEISYPTEAKDKGVEGAVFVEFVVSKEGKSSQHRIAKGIGSGCDEEALRVIQKLDIEWNAPKQQGIPVNQKLVIPVRFKLNNESSSEMRKTEPLEHNSSDSIPEDVFTIVEKSAFPKGGYPEFYNYVKENLKYPEDAVKASIEGRVFVEFIVDHDGNLTSPRVVRGIGYGCDAEALRVISEALPWDVATQRGNVVKQKIILPITFKLK